MLDISVIICTHNPKPQFLRRVLVALEDQTLPQENWEVLLIDNRSDSALADQVDLRWHVNGRHIREEQLGVIYARLRGIEEASSELLVFVDDDNVLAPDYLETALGIDDKYPWIGAWSGQVIPEFEVEPPSWLRPFWCYLPIRMPEHDLWTNIVDFGHEPIGAGMCVRAVVAKEYLQKVYRDPTRQALLADGTFSTTMIDDSDLAFTACDLNFGMGQCKDLKLTHIIPAARLEVPYLARQLEARRYGALIVISLYGKEVARPQRSTATKLFNWYVRMRMNPRQRQLYDAIARGELMAYTRLIELGIVKGEHSDHSGQ